MAFLALGAFMLVVIGIAWLASRQRPRATGCCAPADSRDDLRMRDAYDDGADGNPPSYSA